MLLLSCREEIFAAKYEGIGPFGGPWRKLEDDIKMDLKDVEGGAWTGFISLGIWTSFCKQSTNKTVGAIKWG
jgi:hypothetical protein